MWCPAITIVGWDVHGEDMEKQAQPTGPEDGAPRKPRKTADPGATPRRATPAALRKAAGNGLASGTQPRKAVPAPTKKKPGSPVSAKATSRASGVEPTHDEIATRAYFIHLRRHGAEGDPDYDWLLAIGELRRERGLN
jgi:hypothetical protein